MNHRRRFTDRHPEASAQALQELVNQAHADAVEAIMPGWLVMRPPVPVLRPDGFRTALGSWLVRVDRARRRHALAHATRPRTVIAPTGII